MSRAAVSRARVWPVLLLALWALCPSARADGTAELESDFFGEPLPEPARFQGPRFEPPPRATGGGSAAGLFEDMVGGLRTLAQVSDNPFFSGAGSAMDAWRAWTEANGALSALDAALDADLADDGDGPGVPSSCAGKPNCNECFERAYGRVNFARMTLARLKLIHGNTIRYIESQEAVGDAVSPIHGMSGLAWKYARADIERARDQFNRTSHAKHAQLIGTMRSALQDVARCEAQHYRNPDWDRRYGFMYLETVKAAYALGE